MYNARNGIDKSSGRPIKPACIMAKLYSSRDFRTNARRKIYRERKGVYPNKTDWFIFSPFGS